MVPTVLPPCFFTLYTNTTNTYTQAHIQPPHHEWHHSVWVTNQPSNHHALQATPSSSCSGLVGVFAGLCVCVCVCVCLWVVMCEKDGTIWRRSRQAVQWSPAQLQLYCSPSCWPVILQCVSSPASRDRERQMERKRESERENTSMAGCYRRSAAPSRCWCITSDKTTSSFQTDYEHRAVTRRPRIHVSQFTA